MKTVSAALQAAPAESVLRNATLRQFFDLPPLPEGAAMAGAVVVEPRTEPPVAGITGSGAIEDTRRT